MISQRLNDYITTLTSQKKDPGEIINTILDEDDDDDDDLIITRDGDEEKSDFEPQENKENNEFNYIYNLSNESSNVSKQEKLLQIENGIFYSEITKDANHYETQKAESNELHLSTQDLKHEHVININSGKLFKIF